MIRWANALDGPAISPRSARRDKPSSVMVRQRVPSSLFHRIWTIKPQALRPVLRRAIVRSRVRGLGRRHPERGYTLAIGLFSSSKGSRHFALRPHLDTKDYDFAIFQDSRPITLAPCTAKMYRYHDPIPVTDPDAFAEPGVIRYHFRAIEKCRRDGFYVCHSEITPKNPVRL